MNRLFIWLDLRLKERYSRIQETEVSENIEFEPFVELLASNLSLQVLLRAIPIWIPLFHFSISLKNTNVNIGSKQNPTHCQNNKFQ
jgi:hypothetical protein